MKSTKLTCLIILLTTVLGCGRGTKPSGDGYIAVDNTESPPADNGPLTVDVTKKYPSRELILQDFVDVEYIPLETTDDFICQGHILDIGTDMIITRNRTQDGNIFIFDRQGKALKKINRKGQGAEEYAGILRVALDEENSELFVADNMTKRVLVYDLDGNYKRAFKQREKSLYGNLFNLDKDNLICHDASMNTPPLHHNGQSFLIVSKQDGSITKEIHIPFEEKKTTWLVEKNETTGSSYALIPRVGYPIVPYQDYFLLADPSCDTIYSYYPDHTMKPYAIRTPTVQSMDPEVFFFIGAITHQYYFMETIIKTGNIEKRSGFPTTDLLYDRNEQAIYEYTVYNGDYTTKQVVNVRTQPLNNKITSWQDLDPNTLIDDLKEGKLKGKLKEIAESLEEDSNPVIMLMSNKK